MRYLTLAEELIIAEAVTGIDAAVSGNAVEHYSGRIDRMPEAEQMSDLVRQNRF